MAILHHFELPKDIDVGTLATEIEAAAQNARNLLLIASHELTDNLEIGLSLVAAAERYVADIIAINMRLYSSNAAAVCATSLSTFPQWLRGARIAAGLSQKELAEKIGVSHAVIGQWECGEFVPRGHNVNSIADTLGIATVALHQLLNVGVME